MTKIVRMLGEVECMDIYMFRIGILQHFTLDRTVTVRSVFLIAISLFCIEVTLKYTVGMIYTGTQAIRSNFTFYNSGL